jgi:membrane-bound lytic murein transglycosylase C
MKNLKIKSKRFALCLGLCCAAHSSVAFANLTSLEKAQQAFDAQFYQAQSDFDSTFKFYQNAYDRAFAAYQAQIQQKWETVLVSMPKVWVSYSAQFEQREIVDFEKGQLIIQQRGPESASSVQEQIARVINKTYAQAFVQDVVSVQVEAELKQNKAQDVVGATPSDDPILAQWLLGDQAQSESARKALIERLAARAKTQQTRDKTGQVVQSVTVSFDVKQAIDKRAQVYLKDVSRFAARERISQALVLSIMENESAFNPMAKSPIPAYGLMQIVPESAGRDATAYLFGQQKLVSPSYLYTPDKNIELGAAYLHILYYRYLKGIDDEQARLYCAIAAYNTGAGNVARAFTGQRNIQKAVAKINQMTAQQVYDHLITHLPYRETQKYLGKVNSRLSHYQDR